MSQFGSRHVGREYALRILYGYDLLLAVGETRPLPPIANWWNQEDKLVVPLEADHYARDIFRTFLARHEEIDQMISQHAHNWRLDRMAPVDRNILRLGVCELMDSKTPVRVVLDESIELAKCYGDEYSTRFVNGILDPLAHTLHQEKFESKPKKGKPKSAS